MACKNAAKFFLAQKTLALRDGALKGKLALVTGGGTGLGKAMATNFARLGADVVIASRSLSRLEKTASEIEASTGSECLPVAMNVRDDKSISAAFDQIQDRFGASPNVLVNNAAANFTAASHRLSANAIRTIVDTVLVGTAVVTTEACQRARKNDTGCSVICISTTYAAHGGPFVLPSSISKAGIDNMCKTLCMEWAKFGFRFNTIAPGAVYTEGAFGQLSPLSDSLNVMAAFARETPVGRVGEVEEVANLASFLASDFSSWMSGAKIDLDGGHQHFEHGSLRRMAYLHKYTDADWEKLENEIKNRTKKSA